MGEKETATMGGAGAGTEAGKAGEPKKAEEQRWVQDDTPEGESMKGHDKSSPELMRATPGLPEELSDTGRHEASMGSIRNLKA